MDVTFRDDGNVLKMSIGEQEQVCENVFVQDMLNYLLAQSEKSQQKG